MQLPPGGTYGPEVPKPIRPIFRAISGPVGSLMLSLGVKIQGRPLLKLTTVGARSGKTRHTVLGWFADEGKPDVWIVIASNGGAARHPGWAHNLARNPDQVSVDAGDGAVTATADIITGSEREMVWSRVVEMAPGYGKYLDTTDRELPIFRLTRQTV